MAPDVTVRSAKDWEEVRTAAVGAGRAFDGHRPEEPFFVERTVRAPTLPLENTLLLRRDGATIGALQVYQRRLNLGDGAAWAGAIGNVYVLPEHRSEGHGHALLAATREFLAEQGYALSVLHADAGLEPFYRDAGWETVAFDRHRATDPRPTGRGAGEFEPFEPAALDDLRALYEASHGASAGSFERSDVLWTDWLLDPAMGVLDGPENVQFYRPDETVTGYLIWRVADGGAEEGGADRSVAHGLEVGYVGSAERAFLESCWDFLAGREADAVEWHPPLADPIGDAAGTLETRPQTGGMVQVHRPADVARLTGGAVRDTSELASALETDSFYWSAVDTF